jgi:hypothetical protein
MLYPLSYEGRKESLRSGVEMPNGQEWFRAILQVNGQPRVRLLIRRFRVRSLPTRPTLTPTCVFAFAGAGWT